MGGAATAFLLAQDILAKGSWVWWEKEFCGEPQFAVPLRLRPKAIEVCSKACHISRRNLIISSNTTTCTLFTWSTLATTTRWKRGSNPQSEWTAISLVPSTSCLGQFSLPLSYVINWNAGWYIFVIKILPRLSLVLLLSCVCISYPASSVAASSHSVHNFCMCSIWLREDRQSLWS